MPWNDADEHRRKFIATKGTIVNSINEFPVETNIAFLGEWEPPSFFQPTHISKKGLPRFIHYPTWYIDSKFKQLVNKLQNADPYVFSQKEKSLCIIHVVNNYIIKNHQ